MTRALPIFLTPETKWPAAIIMFVMASALYMGANHFHIFTPQYLPMTAVDNAVPFVPMSVWVYISEYIFFLAVYANCRDMANLNKYLYSFFALQTFSVAIFWLWPTTYPRDLFPLPADLNWITYEVFSSLRRMDSPASCCPSLHVSSVFLSVFIFLDEQKHKFPLFFGWGLAIALSTLTTKQHYLVDVIAGMFLSVVFYWIFHRYIPYRYVTLPTLIGVQAKR